MASPRLPFAWSAARARLASLSPGYAWLLAALAVGLRLPFLAAGFVSDDYVLLAAIEKRSTLASTPLNLWTFYDGVPAHNAQLIAAGGLPWWTEPTARHAFWRPLSSALLTAAHACFGDRALGYHALAIGLFGVNVLLAGNLFRRLLPGRAAPLALLFFAVHSLHVGSSLWMSAIHIPLSMTLGLVALALHIHHRVGGLRFGRSLSALALAMSLLAGEHALSVVVYFFAYEAFVSASAPRERARALIVPAGVALAYLALYVSLHFGAHAIDGYLDPTEGLPRFLSALGDRAVSQLPRLVTSPGEDLFVDLGEKVTSGFAVVSVAFVLALAAIGFGVDVRVSRSAAGWALASCVAALPALVGPTDRALYGATLGSSAALGIVVSLCAARVLGEGRLVGGLRFVVAVPLALVVFFQGALAAATNFDAARSTIAASASQLREVMSLPLIWPETTDVVVITADDSSTGPWGGTLYAWATGRVVRSWQALSLTPGPHRIVRIAADAFELEAALDSGFSMYLYRNAALHPMKPGDRVDTPGLTIEVLAVDGGRPTHVRVHARVGESFDDPHFQFASRFDGRIVPIRLPPVGTGTILR